MPMRATLSGLPAATRRELDRRLLRSGFAGYVDLSEWLAGRGFLVGKSAIGAYVKANRSRIIAGASSDSQVRGECQLRALCLLAASLQGPATQAQVLARADRFLTWSLTGR